MSDQPKPTGEWTTQTVYDLYHKLDGGPLAIANAYNAALAAERKEQKEWLDAYEQEALKHESEIQQLRDQLTAEREKSRAGGWLSQEALDEYAKVEQEVIQLRERIAAEREKVERLVTGLHRL